MAANVALPAPAGARADRGADGGRAGHRLPRGFPACEVLLMAAAVADFRPRNAAQTKLKKDQGAPRIELEATEDVISALAAQRRPGQILVGFAAEHGAGAVQYGRDKLERKRLDAVVINDIAEPGIGFDAAENEVTIVTAAGGERHVARVGKEQVAEAVLDEVDLLIGEGDRSSSRPSRRRSRRKSLRPSPPSPVPWPPTSARRFRSGRRRCTI